MTRSTGAAPRSTHVRGGRASALALALIVSSFAAPGTALGAVNPAPGTATKTTPKPGPKTTSKPAPDDRIRPESQRLPARVRVARAINATTPVNVRASYRFSGLDRPYGLSGFLDEESGTGLVDYRHDALHLRYRVIKSDAWYRVEPADREIYLADWVHVDFTTDAAPDSSVIMALTFARRDLLLSVPSWKATPPAKGDAAGLRRYHGVGDLETLSMIGSSGYRGGVDVDVFLDRNNFVERVDWQIRADPKSKGPGSATGTLRYTKAAPRSIVKPRGRIAEFDALDTTAAATDTESADTSSPDTGTAEQTADTAVADTVGLTRRPRVHG